MIPPIDIRHTMQDLSARLGLYAEERMLAAVRAMNHAMGTVRKEAARATGRYTVAGEYPGLKVGAIKARILQTRAGRSDPRALLTFSNARIRLFSWRLNRVQTKYGVGIRSTGSLPRTLMRVDAVTGKASPVTLADLSHAFIQRSRRNGSANVWLRQGKSSMPIDVLVTPSLSETLVTKKLNAALRDFSGERFQVEFQREAVYRLSKR